MQPIIAVPADIREFDRETWHCVPDQYLDALSKVANVMPLFVPALGDAIDFDALLARIDGIFLTGSKANVHPSLFGKQPNEKFEPYDPERDATSLPLIRMAIEKGVPLFAVCRGVQELNVALGGSLKTEIQEDEGNLDHRMPDTLVRDEQFALAHPISVTKGGCLQDIIGPRVQVNSLHRQALDDVAPRLQIEARADDGTVEAVSVKHARGFAMGVQWHPEYWAETDTPSRQLFEAFGDAARAYAAGKSHVADPHHAA